MKVAGKRVLVTGGAGFIGSHLVERLVRQGAHVRVFDNFSSGCRDNLKAVYDDVEIMDGDARDAAAVNAAVKGCEIVSHQAAQLEITRCLEDPIDDLQANTIATLNVLDATAKAGVARVIYASSACVYGQPLYIPSDEAKHPTDPNWAYGVSKLACEKYAAIFSERTGIPMAGLRYAIIYGPREWYGRVLTIFLKRLAAGQTPVIFGDGKQVRDFTYVGDLIDLHDQILEREPPGHHVFNVSTGIATSVADLARLALQVAGRDLQPVHEEIRPGERSQIVDEGRLRLPSELQALVLDPKKAREKLGWIAKVALAEGLSREWEWLLANPDRWNKMRY
jgi:UDP-glucose 4-epimerase